MVNHLINESTCIVYQHSEPRHSHSHHSCWDDCRPAMVFGDEGRDNDAYHCGVVCCVGCGAVLGSPVGACIAICNDLCGGKMKCELLGDSGGD